MRRLLWLALTSLLSTSCSLIASSLLPEDTGGGGSALGGFSSGGAPDTGGAAGAEPTVGGGGESMGGGGRGPGECAAPRVCLQPPVGATDLVTLAKQPFPGAATICADGDDAIVHFFSPATTADCGCSCGAWSGGACGSPAITCYGSTGCSGPPLTMGLDFSMGTCVAVPNQYDTLSCVVTGATTPVTDPGACAPSAATLSPKTFASEIHACNVDPSLGCTGDAVCVPPGTCAALDGDVACPPELPDRVLAYEGAEDERACSDCTCNPSASCAGGTLTFHDNDDCSDSDPPIVVGATCGDVSSLMDGNSGAGRVSGTSITGSCTVGGGVASGAVLPHGPRTYCCPLGGAP